MKKILIILINVLIITNLKSQKFLNYNLNKEGKGQVIKITFTKGKNFGHPVMAIWLTTTDGKYIQTLYVSETIAKSIYPHGKAHEGKWQPGIHRHPSTLPYWSHSRGIKAEDGLFLPSPNNPITDAYTGATPLNHFTIETRLDTILKGKAFIYFEINQPFDFNDYWHNTLYPDNQDYKKSGQPSLVYFAILDFDNPEPEYYMNPIGHGSPTGADGKLYTNISTLTTALRIVDKIKIEIR